MRAWIREQYRQHPWLTVAVGLYLALSAVELTRILLFDRPQTYAAGLYDWEHAPAPRPEAQAIAERDPEAGVPATMAFAPRLGRFPAPEGEDGSLPFRWTRDEAYLLEPVLGPVVTVPLYVSRPDMPRELPVTLRLEGGRDADVVLAELVLRDNGWQFATFYLPPLLGESTWAASVDGWAELVEAERQAREAGARGWLRRWFHDWQELKPWHRPPGPPSVWLHVVPSETFVPAELTELDDDRRLGVGVGELTWGAELPAEGLGFHRWEADADGVRFRWTRLRASLPLATEGNHLEGDRLAFRLRAHHPDIERRPVRVEIFWIATRIHRLELTDRSWHEITVAVPSPPGERGVLTLIVDRTWNPAEAGVAPDNRELGVAMTEPTWD